MSLPKFEQGGAGEALLAGLAQATMATTAAELAEGDLWLSRHRGRPQLTAEVAAAHLAVLAELGHAVQAGQRGSGEEQFLPSALIAAEWPRCRRSGRRLPAPDIERHPYLDAQADIDRDIAEIVVAADRPLYPAELVTLLGPEWRWAFMARLVWGPHGGSVLELVEKSIERQVQNRRLQRVAVDGMTSKHLQAVAPSGATSLF